LCAEQAKIVKQLANQTDERQGFNMSRNRMSYANLHDF
jgi:hypothetical protein